MEIHNYIIYISGLLLNGYILWVFLQLTLASWGSNKAKDSWCAIVKTPFMQLIVVKWLSICLLIALTLHILLLLFLVTNSFYTGIPIFN